MPTLEGLTLQILFYYFCPLNNQQVYHCYIISCAQSVWKKDVWYRFSSKHTHTVRLLTGHPSWPLPPPIINVLFPPRCFSCPHHILTQASIPVNKNHLTYKFFTNSTLTGKHFNWSILWVWKGWRGVIVNDAWPLIPILTDKRRRYCFLLCSRLVLNNHSAC